MRKSKRFIITVATLVLMVLLTISRTGGAGQETDFSVKDSICGLAPPTGPRTGKTNPMLNPARRCLLAEDWLGDATHTNNQSMLQYWNAPIDDSLSDWKNLSGSNGISVPNCNIPSGPIAIAKGRVHYVTKDEAFIAFYTNVSGAAKPVVGYLDQPSWCNYIIPGTYYVGIPTGTFNTIEIATGDIDGEVDGSGEVHDEIIIAYRKKNPGSGYSVWITALKYSSTSCFTVLDSIQTDDPVVDSGYSFMSLTMGDYNNDGKDEIAVCYLVPSGPSYNDTYFHFVTFDYDAAAGKLVQRNKLIDDAGTVTMGRNLVDLTSGDFDGDGADEIASIIGRCTTNNHDDTHEPSMLISIFKMDENLKIEWKSFYDSSASGLYSNKGSAITSGFFKYSPSSDANKNYSVARRQLAIIFQSEHGEGTWQPYIVTFDVDSDFKVTLVSKIGARGSAGNYPDKREVASLKPEITAGRFLTLGNPLINDQIAASWGHTPEHGWNSEMIFNVYSVDYNMKISIPGFDQTGYGFASQHSHVNYSVWNATSVPIVAACTQEGKSYYLGTPIHITIPLFIRPNRVVQEPPKHLDYLPDENEEWKIVNVSRTRTFYAAFKDTENTSITTTSTDQTNWNIGGSEKVTAKETIGGGIPDIEEAEITATESEKVSYDYDSVTKHLNGNYSEVTISSEFDTTRDDYLQVYVQLMDIWRYPIYGLKTKDGKNAFYEVVMPGPKYQYNTSGCDFSDYYQPVHENGNVLSYPLIGTNKGIPYDLGSFYVGTDKKTCPMTNSSKITVGTLSGYQGVSWTNSTWDTETKSHTHKLSENIDLKLGFKMDTMFEKVSVEGDFSFHNSNSWSKTSFSENKTSSNKGITIYFPDDGVKKYSYNFRPIVYATTDGTLKLAHTVDFDTSDGFAWWHNNYYGQPDIALNLPNKFYWKKSASSKYYGTWYFQKYRQDRSQMRGVFLLKKEPDLKSTENNWYLASSPTAGDKIWVLTRVYNYSLGTATGEFKVRFSYADFNSALDDDPPDLHTIGEVTVNTLDPGERKEVYIEWDTTGLGGEVRGSGKNYVIYITVDPDNEVLDEIHELYVADQSPVPGPCPVGPNAYSADCKIFCGSNNQGYWPWDNSLVILSPDTVGDENRDAPVDISIKDGSLQIEYTPESEKYPAVLKHVFVSVDES